MSADRIGNIAKFISKFGLGTSLSVFLIWQVILPLKDAAIETMHRQAEATEEVVELVREMKDSIGKIDRRTELLVGR